MNPTLLPLPPGGRRGGGGGYFAYGAETAAILPAASPVPCPGRSRPDTRIHRRGGGGGLMAAAAAPPGTWPPASAAILCLVASLGCFPSHSGGGAAALTGGSLRQSLACAGALRPR